MIYILQKKLFINYLKSIDDFDEKVKPNKQIPYKLLKILSNNSNLNDLFSYIYDNNKSYIYMNNETNSERGKPNSSYNLFKMKVIKKL